MKYCSIDLQYALIDIVGVLILRHTFTKCICSIRRTSTVNAPASVDLELLRVHSLTLPVPDPLVHSYLLLKLVMNFCSFFQQLKANKLLILIKHMPLT